MVLWGRSRDELHHRIYSKQPIREWEGQPPHKYGEIIHSSVVSLYNSYTQVTWRHPRESAGSYEVWPHRCFIREEHILRCRLRMRWQQQSQYPTLIKRLISVFKATPSLVLNTKRHRLTADGASDQTVWELNTMSEWSYRCMSGAMFVFLLLNLCHMSSVGPSGIQWTLPGVVLFPPADPLPGPLSTRIHLWGIPCRFHFKKTVTLRCNTAVMSG